VTRHECVFPWHSRRTVPGRMTRPRSNGLSGGYAVTRTLNSPGVPEGRMDSVRAPWVHVSRGLRRSGFILDSAEYLPFVRCSRKQRHPRIQMTNTPLLPQYMTRSLQENSLFQTASGIALVQLPMMMALVAYYSDPQFAFYTTQLLNTTTRQMEVEVEDFRASALYIAASVCTALFAAASRTRANLDADTHYSMETLQEMSMWDLSFWAAQLLQHVCLVAFMCTPIDWYFLTLVVGGMTLMLLLISRLPLVIGGRSKENILALLFGMLYFVLYTAVRRHGHVIFFMLMLVLDTMMLVGHTFDQNPDMQTIGNCRLCYCAAMSVTLMVSYTV
jgi:hypothetical protein